jgi:hypothetical protein
VVDHVRTFDGRPIEEVDVYDGGPTSFWKDGRTQNKGVGNWRFGSERSVSGYACGCPEPTDPTRPAVVLDPFGGTGTVALMAKALGRQAHHVDLSRDYCKLAKWRVTDPGEMARAMQVEKPPEAPSDMDSLLDLIGEDGAA